MRSLFPRAFDPDVAIGVETHPHDAKADATLLIEKHENTDALAQFAPIFYAIAQEIAWEIRAKEKD